MRKWHVTWFDGTNLRLVEVQSDPYNLIAAIGAAGIYNLGGIIKIEQVPQ